MGEESVALVDSLVMADQALGGGAVTAQVVRERFESQGGDLGAVFPLLEEGYRATHQALASLTDGNLARPVGSKKRRTAESLFAELIEHSLYHAGQINHVRGLWEGAQGISA